MHIEHSDFHDHLVRGLAHKMNNILGLFHGYLGLLMEDEKLAPELRDGLTKIQEGTTAAVDLLDRTRALARPSSVVWREVDPEKFLNSVRPALMTCLPPGIDLVIEKEADLPPLWADATRLRMALMEIVRNAGDAAPPNSRVTVSAFTEQASGNVGSIGSCAEQPLRWVVFAVMDEGPGVDPEFESKLFRPFCTTRQHQNATGLGLSVALGLAQQMNGVIRYTTQPGRTIFRLMLPACSE